MTFVDFVAAVVVVVATTGIVEFWNRHSIVFCWKSFWVPFETCLCKYVCIRLCSCLYVFLRHVIFVLLMIIMALFCLTEFSIWFCIQIHSVEHVQFSVTQFKHSISLPYCPQPLWPSLSAASSMLFLVMEFLQSSHFDSYGCIFLITDSIPIILLR